MRSYSVSYIFAMLLLWKDHIDSMVQLLVAALSVPRNKFFKSIVKKPTPLQDMIFNRGQPNA